MEFVSIIFFITILGYIAFVNSVTRFISFTQPSILGFYSIVFLFMTFSLLNFEITDSFKEREGYVNFLYALFFHIVFLLLPYLVCYSFNVNNLRIASANFRSADIVHFNNEKKVFFIVLFFFVLIFIHQLIYIPNIPIFLLIQNVSGEELAIVREESFKLNNNFYVYFWHFNRMIFAPLVVLASFLIYKNEKKARKKWFLIFILTLILACINSSLSSALAPVAIIFLMVFLIKSYLDKKISIVYTVNMFFVVISFPLLIGFIFSDGNFIESASSTIYEIFHRFSIETFDRTLFYFDLFPYQMDYLGGSTNRLFTIITGNNFFNVQNFAFIYYLEMIMGAEVRPHLIHGSLNANFIGYMNADFGMSGVIISSLIMGIIITYFEMKMMKLSKNIFVLSLYILLFIIFWKMMGTQPVSILVGHGGILILLLAMLFAIVGKLNKSQP